MAQAEVPSSQRQSRDSRCDVAFIENCPTSRVRETWVGMHAARMRSVGTEASAPILLESPPPPSSRPPSQQEQALLWQPGPGLLEQTMP